VFKKIAVIIKKIRAIRVIRVQKKSLLLLKKFVLFELFVFKKNRCCRVKKSQVQKRKKRRQKEQKTARKKGRSVLHIYAFLPLFLAAF